MLRLRQQYLVENVSGFFLIGVGLVCWLRGSQQRKRIENGGLVILWVTEVKLLHCFLISEGARSVIELIRILVERFDRRDVIPLPLRLSANHVCFLYGGRSVP